MTIYRQADGQQLAYAKLEGLNVCRYGKGGKRLPSVKCCFWQFIHVSDGSARQVGPQYPTKEALLADARRYATEFGF